MLFSIGLILNTVYELWKNGTPGQFYWFLHQELKGLKKKMVSKQQKNFS